MMGAIFIFLALMTSIPTCLLESDETIIIVSLYDRAIITCPVTGSSRIVPHWIINGGRPLRQDELPSRHEIIEQNLNIYPLLRSDNGSTYQCALVKGEITGPKVLLIVNTTLTEMALRINYIDFEIGDITTSISLKRYNRDSCTTFILEGYQLSYLEEYDLLEPQIYRSNTNNNFSIETEELIDLYFRVIAKDGDNMICSQPLAGNFFYHFNESETLEHTVPNGDACIPIPESLHICDETVVAINLPTVDEDKSCICSLYDYNTSAECIGNCSSTTYNIELVNNEVCFHNVGMNNTSIYYDCNLNLCDSPENDCFVYFILSSHKIIIDGPPSTPDIFYSNNSVLCFEAYSSPHHPVLRYNVNVTNEGSLVLNDSLTILNQCFDASRLLEMYGSLNVSISATNLAGTSDTAEKNLQKPENKATTSPQSTIPIPTIAGTVVSAAILTSTIVIIVIIVIIRCPKKRTKVNFPVVYYNST